MTALDQFSDEELAAALAAREAADVQQQPAPAQEVPVAEVPAAAGNVDVPVVQPVSIDDVAAENARLRAELLAENEKLRAALAESRSAGLSFVGLTDDDVRRLEHPEEFTVSNDELHSRLAAIESQLGVAAAAPAPAAQVAP